MDIETRKSFNKLKHYLTLFNDAYFDKDHMWILYEVPAKPKLYFINKTYFIDFPYSEETFLWI